MTSLFMTGIIMKIDKNHSVQLQVTSLPGSRGYG